MRMLSSLLIKTLMAMLLMTLLPLNMAAKELWDPVDYVNPLMGT